MDRKQFLEQVKSLRVTGKSIRTIALELNVHRSRVERALRALRPLQPDESAPALEYARPGNLLEKGDFVGRQRELAILTAALDDSLSGQGGRVVMLVGEPGIGKTSTAKEFALYAESQGVQVLWGRCYEGIGMSSYWPWVQGIRAYVRRQETGRLRSEMGAGAADIAGIVPDVKERLTDLKPSPGLDSPEQARVRLFDSITSFLRRASQTQALVLVLDNLHWADRPSLLLLEFLSQEMGEGRLLIVGTYRDDEMSPEHPLSRTLGELTKERHFHRIPLRSLTEEDVGQLIRLLSGITPAPALAEAVYRHTQGNPLFVTEVVRLLVQEEELTRDHHWGSEGLSLGIPDGVREAIGRRLHRLSDQCNQTLTTASIIGREFEFKLLSRLSSGISEEQLLAVMDEALAAHLIEELPGGADRYQFSHALVQQTLAEELSMSRRVRLHARIAEALEALYGPDAEAHAPELAHHFAQAEPVLGTDKLVKYCLLAGEQALAAHAWEEALQHFQRGLAAKGVSPEGTVPARDDEEAALLCGLGRARASTADRQRRQEAVDILSRAFDYYETTGAVAKAVAIAEYPLPLPPVGRTGSAMFIPRALKLVPPDTRAAGRLLSSYGAELGRVENDYEGAQEAFRRALAIARREQDLPLEIRSLAASANVDLSHIHTREALEKAGQAIEFARGLDDPQAMWQTHLVAVRAHWDMGDSGAARQHVLALQDLSVRLRDRHRLAQAFAYAARLDRQLGNWRRARESSDQGLAIAPQDHTLLGDRVMLEYEVGDFDDGEVYLERLLESIPPVADRSGTIYSLPAQVIPWVARTSGGMDRLDVAAEVARAALSSPFSNPIYVLWPRAGLALLAVVRGDVAAAAEQYEILEPHRGSMAETSCFDHLLGLLSHTVGNLDRATVHFEDALAFCRKAGYRPELAWSLFDYADMLLSRNSPGDQQKANTLLDESLAITKELGMRPLLERVVLRQQKAKSQSARAPAYPDGLSQREVEVLRLVGAGKSNPEVAEGLFISINTVTRHLTNIFTKTGTVNRAEAAVYAARHGLL